MHPGIRKLAQLAHSFPVYDRVIRYKLPEFYNPVVLSQLRTLKQAGQATILAVDLANQEVVIGQMGQDGPGARAVIDGKTVTIPR
jgi:hypothetical protein